MASNLYEEDFFKAQLQRLRQNIKFSYHKITNLKHVMLFYFFTTLSIGLYIFSDTYLNSGMNFLLFWVIILIIVMSQFKKIKIVALRATKIGLPSPHDNKEKISYTTT